MFLFLLTAQILLVAAIWQYHQVLVVLYDEAITEMYTGLFGRSSIRDDMSRKAVRAALFVSPTTIAIEDNETYQRGLADLWRTPLEFEGFAGRIITNIVHPDALENYNLLILPVSAVMSNDEIDAVKAFLRKGNGVIFSWATGTRDETGAWRSQSFLQHIGGLELSRPPQALDEAQSISALEINAQSPVAESLSPGVMLRTHRHTQPVGARVLEPRVTTAGTWRQPDGTTGPVGIAHGSYFEGRFVWFGYTIDAADGDPLQYQAFQRIARNAIIWAGRQPRAYTQPWPRDAGHAMSVSLHVSRPADVDLRLLTVMQQHGVPLTLFVEINALLESPSDWAGWAESAQLGIWDPRPLESFRYGRRAVRELRAARKALQRINGDQPVGYRRDAGANNDALLDALVRAGYAYVSVQNTSLFIPEIQRAYRPIRFVTRVRELWALPETAHSGASVRKALNDIKMIGGYLHLALSPDDINDETMDSISGILDQANRGNAWLASVGDVAQHWRLWGNLSIATQYPSPHRVSIRISNTGLETVRDVVFYIDLDQVYEELEIKPSTLGSPQLVTTTQDGRHWTLFLPRVPPGKNYAYHLHRPRTP